MEQPNWTDSLGNAVPKSQVPRAASLGGWVVEVSPSTDKEGWHYGNNYGQLAQPRVGGSASQRATGVQ